MRDEGLAHPTGFLSITIYPKLDAITLGASQSCKSITQGTLEYF